MSADKDQKTEDPSAKRLGDARKKGNIPRSMDVNASVGLLMAAVLLFWQWRNIAELTRNRMAENLSTFPQGDLTIPALQVMALTLTREVLLAIAPFLLGILLVGLLASYAQVGILYTLAPLKPSFAKLNPIQGFKRILSLRGVVETLKGILKIAVVGALSYAVIQERYVSIVTAVQAGRAQLGALLADTAWTIAWRSALALFVLGLMDYAYQRWEWWRNLKMTKQEVKDEAKQQEGSPEVKAEIRKRQRMAARRRMMQEVPTATVVITNPTHFAVALKYDRDEMEVPVVVAKGTDLVAKRIRDLAREAMVPLVENKPVAQALYRQVEVGDEIPPDMYAVVAEILVAVTRADAKARA